MTSLRARSTDRGTHPITSGSETLNGCKGNKDNWLTHGFVNGAEGGNLPQIGCCKAGDAW